MTLDELMQSQPTYWIAMAKQRVSLSLCHTFNADAAIGIEDEDAYRLRLTQIGTGLAEAVELLQEAERLMVKEGVA